MPSSRRDAPKSRRSADPPACRASLRAHAQGYLTLVGRIKELINRGGEKISPLEVDAALLAHPSVAEAVSFGAPDEKVSRAGARAQRPKILGREQSGSGGLGIGVRGVSFGAPDEKGSTRKRSG